MNNELLKAHFLGIYPPSDLVRWFDPLVFSFNRSTGCCTVIFPHKFFADWFFTTSLKKLKEGLALLPTIVSVQYALGSADNILYKQEEINTSPIDNKTPLGNCTNIHQQFENFITNKKNSTQIQIAQEAIRNFPKKVYNPIVIVGPSGTGKTHLMNAMANCLQKSPTLFFHGKAQQLLSKDLDALTLLTSKVFFIDDLQSIKENKEYQRKFLYFFDQAKTQQLLIVVCLDAQPLTYTGISNKIKMRLAEGLLLELKKPDISIRLKYTLHQAQVHGLSLSKEAAISLAQRHNDFRTINGAITTLLAFKDTEKSMMDAAQVIGNEGLPKFLSLKEITKQVAKAYNVAPLDILGKKRNKTLSSARQMAIFLCRELTGSTLAQIGQHFGGRDHSSIVYTVKKVQQLQQSNKDTNNLITQLKKECLTNQPM